MSADYHPANSAEPCLRSTSSFGVVPDDDFSRKVGTIRQFAERRIQQERKLSERDLAAGQEVKQAAAVVGATGTPTATLAPQPPQLPKVVELIEWARPDGSSVYILSPEAQKSLGPDLQHEWVEGPVWAAIHKMTGWPCSQIIALDIRVRVLPPL